jgi:hydrogenase/urease accessory protein HupE
MARTLRWLIVLLALVAPARATAHPLLSDALNVTMSPDRLIIDVQSTLRSVVLAAGATPEAGDYFSVAEVNALVNAHAAALERQLSLRVNDSRVRAQHTEGELAQPLDGPIQRHVELARFHAHFRLIYTLSVPATRWSLEEYLDDESPSEQRFGASYAVSVRRAGDATMLAMGLLTPERGFDFRMPEAARSEGAPHDFFGFFWAGLRHIASGWDHLLFVAALVLATRRLNELVKVVLAFTVAHSLTLTLTVLRLVHVPGAVVEPLIALSIVAISLENLLRPHSAQGALRLLTAFGFGLVHGLGFAGPLIQALQGAPPRALTAAILGFSAGVELGQQLLVLPLFFALTNLAEAPPIRAFSRALRLGSLLTALGGAFFLFRALEPLLLA